jgi:hypothetical protein
MAFQYFKPAWRLRRTAEGSATSKFGAISCSYCPADCCKYCHGVARLVGTQMLEAAGEAAADKSIQLLLLLALLVLL